MVARTGPDAHQELQDYLWEHYAENIFLLSDVARSTAMAQDEDTFTLLGYRHRGEIVGVQAFYRYGRWFPHFVDTVALDLMLTDMMPRHVRWVMGVCRVVDPILEQLSTRNMSLDHDERDFLCVTDRSCFRPLPSLGIRPATAADASAVAHLRLMFENEYFGIPLGQIDRDWCLRVANRYIEQGTMIGTRDSQVVSMAAVEASLPQIAQIGAVYTMEPYRRQGLAKGVVSALCEDLLLAKARVSLVVRKDNEPALCAYRALGFHHWYDYRMAHFG